MRQIFSCLLSLLLLVPPSWAQNVGALPPFIQQQANVPILHEGARIQPVYSQHGMVVSADKYASQVGQNILMQGGNAVDAAVAVAFTMAVTMPRAGNLGGGGFMLVYDAKNKTTRAIDYRDKAPLAASADMFLDGNGEVDETLARFSHKSAGVPGTVKGMELAFRLYGSLEWQALLDPAIHYASNGVTVSQSLAESLQKKAVHLWKSPAARKVFFKQDHFYSAGDTLYQKDLAKTLVTLAKEGADAFYKGDIATRIALDMKKNGGLVTMQDLAEYQAVLRDPLVGYYRGYKVLSMPPPSSGGVHLIQMLKALEQFPIQQERWGHGSSDTMHVMAEVMRQAYADRSKYLGDTDFVNVPIKALMSDLYAIRTAKGISMASATPSELVEGGKFLPDESPQTTHFTIVDKWGNVVTNTYTLNFSYGSGHMVAGTGILLNNEMDDFVSKVGVANAYGLIGNEKNAIEPEKRPLSSMTPTLVFDADDQFYMALGSPGGSRIITSVLNVLMNVIDHNMNLAEAITAPRMHHQYMPDKVQVEKGFSLDTLKLLNHKGHTVEEVAPMGAVMAVKRAPHGQRGYVAFADTRRADAFVAVQSQPQDSNPLARKEMDWLSDLFE